jgi:hypothetical protein
MAEAQRKTLNANPRHQPHVVIPTSQNKVSVGCKLPNGMHLDIRQAGQPTQRVTLKGINSLSEGMILRPSVRSGFAVTENVPKEFFEHWMELNAAHPAVKNNLIFAHTQVASVRAMGEEFKNELHGFEPIDPNKPGPNIESRKDDD